MTIRKALACLGTGTIFATIGLGLVPLLAIMSIAEINGIVVDEPALVSIKKWLQII